VTRVKICGITEVAYARAAIEAGADLIGVVLAPSPRRVSYEQARRIAEEVKKHNLPVVGVFVNTPAAEVNRAAADGKLDLVQLSGDESWEYCREIERPLIKTVHIMPGWDEARLLSYLEEGQRALGSRSPLYLLDSFAEDSYGGTGRAFAWGIARRAVENFPVVIAGGLSPENVGEVVKDLKPWGVDVSSGVESGGVKDVKKIKAFIQAVRSAD
jgi:phosphoribosylanthranilate isomerase